MNDVSVIVCTHSADRWPWLEECLASLERQTLKPAEVIVVVDGCREIWDRLTARNSHELLLRTPRQSGLSFARNLGLAHASGAFTAFLDDDAVAVEGWLQTLRRVLDDPTVAGVGGISLPYWEGRQPRWLPEELLWTLGCSYPGMPDCRSEVRNVYGGSACFRREVFTTFGGFNPDLGRTAVGLAGCEETELCLRVVNLKPTFRIVHEPGAVIYHRVPRRRQSVKYILSRCLGEGRSKAILRNIVGQHAKHPLARETKYLLQTVPRGVTRNLGDFLVGNPWALARALLLLLGVAETVFGYEWARLSTIALHKHFRALPPPVISDVPNGKRVANSDRSMT